MTDVHFAMIVWNAFKTIFTLFLIAGLMFSGGVFSVLLYAKISGNEPWFAVTTDYAASPQPAESDEDETDDKGDVSESQAELPAAASLDAPVVRQFPELPAGCEITSLTMLLQYYGVQKDKMELVKEMKTDPTPVRLGKNGSIAYWGDPNTGFVGDVTGKSRGYSIYHGPLFELLKTYVPTAVDLTGEPFERLERQIADGVPVLVWTTIDYKVPDNWIVWNSPTGPIRATFKVHAVLLVGYDESNVYVNDPYTGKKSLQIDKERFIATWDVMGRQALSYTIPEKGGKTDDI